MNLRPPDIKEIVPIPALSFIDKFALTEMEIDILKGQSNGLSYKEIAPIVNRSVRTVEAKACVILDKMKCRQIAHAVAKAIRLKIIE